MYIRLIDFLNKNNVIFPAQFGFRENHSTSHALILIVDKIQRAIEEKLVSYGIFLDFCKALIDTVDHSILLYKLQHYGIRGITIKWFNSYLKARKQFVSVGNVKSNLNEDLLGPLLFLIYINDFNSSSDLLDFHLFADDSNLFYSDNKSWSLA